MEFLKKSPKDMERGLDLARAPLTPKSERQRSTYGSLLMTVQGVDGLCQKHRKCIKKNDHASLCWPGD